MQDSYNFHQLLHFEIFNHSFNHATIPGITNITKLKETRKLDKSMHVA